MCLSALRVKLCGTLQQEVTI
uniref:Uncharacterized protein n=1 Tax=Anguilla anguilla TaxID=7936 RepID=A0A0E9VB49_ANGAN